MSQTWKVGKVNKLAALQSRRGGLGLVAETHDRGCKTIKATGYKIKASSIIGRSPRLALQILMSN